jgi:hypothetical protein
MSAEDVRLCGITIGKLGLPIPRSPKRKPVP